MSRETLQRRRDVIAMSRALGQFTDDVIRDYDVLLAVADAAAALESGLEHTGALIPKEAWDAWLAFRVALAALDEAP